MPCRTTNCRIPHHVGYHVESQSFHASAAVFRALPKLQQSPFSTAAGSLNGIHCTYASQIGREVVRTVTFPPETWKHVDASPPATDTRPTNLHMRQGRSMGATGRRWLP
jgi:hypothetical protein